MDSIAEPFGVNGHQEPIAMTFCRGLRGACRYRAVGDDALGEYQLGHWGRFAAVAENHPTFTAPGLTYGHNLRMRRLYHPLKCEADGGIGGLAAACARTRGFERETARNPDRRPGTSDAASAGETEKGGLEGRGERLEPPLNVTFEHFRRAYFEKKPWAIEFETRSDPGSGSIPNSSASPGTTSSDGFHAETSASEDAYLAAVAAAKARARATEGRALEAARPYARPMVPPQNAKERN
jgi:hypothetical protein